MLVIFGCGSFGGSDEAPPAAADAGDASDGGGVEGAPSTDAGAPFDCTASAITSWSAPRRLTQLVGASGELHFTEPFVLADGLTLLLTHANGPTREVFRATRSARTAPWGTPTRLVGFSNPDYAEPYPTAVGPAEVIVAIPWAAASLDIGALVPEGGAYATLHFGELQRPDTDFYPTLSADGTTLLYAEFGASPQNPFRTLLQATRGAPDPASPWGSTRGVDEAFADGGASLPPDVETPAMTPDARGLFYGDATHETVHYATRGSIAQPFFSGKAAPITIDALKKAGAATHVRSITADGCEAYLTSDRDGVPDAYVATRLR